MSMRSCFLFDSFAVRMRPLILLLLCPNLKVLFGPTQFQVSDLASAHLQPYVLSSLLILYQFAINACISPFSCCLQRHIRDWAIYKIPPSEPSEECNPTITLMLAQGDTFQTFTLQNCMRTNLYCFKPYVCSNLLQH